MTDDPDYLRALTLHRPWDFAITRLPVKGRRGRPGAKRIENRSWRPPAWLIGRRLAIHGGRRWDEGAEQYLRAFGFEVPEEWPGGISGIVTVTGYVAESADPWFMGPLGWVLADLEPVDPPVPCSGAQGLWRVPAEVLRRLR